MPHQYSFISNLEDITHQICAKHEHVLNIKKIFKQFDLCILIINRNQMYYNKLIH